jgi:5-methylcytosine-specific restriction protein A
VGQHSHLYKTARWQSIRKQQLTREPLCRFCQGDGRITAATVCDHIEPHRGDLAKFVAGPFQSLCATCHSGEKRSSEEHGKERQRIGPDGWPVA